MQNVRTRIEKGILTITVDLNADGQVSASGKSVVIASTHGNVMLDGGVKFGLNIYKPSPKKSGVAGLPHGVEDKELVITK